jgi:hypothetical protein
MQTHEQFRHLSFEITAGLILPSGPLKRLAGAQDFRDFSCLPPAEENRAQPADPAPAADLTYLL